MGVGGARGWEWVGLGGGGWGVGVDVALGWWGLGSGEGWQGVREAMQNAGDADCCTCMHA